MTDDQIPTQPSPSGDQVPWLVRMAEKLSKGRSGRPANMTIDRAIWTMVIIQAMQMDTSNLTWLYLLFL